MDEDFRWTPRWERWPGECKIGLSFMLLGAPPSQHYHLPTHPRHSWNLHLWGFMEDSSCRHLLPLTPFLTLVLSWENGGGAETSKLLITVGSSWDQPSSRSPPRVTSLEEKTPHHPGIPRVSRVLCQELARWGKGQRPVTISHDLTVMFQDSGRLGPVPSGMTWEGGRVYGCSAWVHIIASGFTPALPFP